ncbi:periplasmic sensor signal transduction histidine kinase [Magnetococcus marinus MC-1]|uniref:histidine kinase n=1 Tax=Magnetococcus marinus (strain ATCC BAA-1437 / JCM 17883 / MC-1) TaxID=156889 RepID=A0LA85_MAGMM|nr:sensor histidine kinase [Magnetococcus marinus]ABK44878.1 periplasmic sensor signal transduction histidine kinase [Magnetococcus marinus MC-1]
MQAKPTPRVVTFIGIFFPLMLAVSLLTYFLYKLDKLDRIALIESHARNEVHALRKLVMADLKGTYSDLDFLVNLDALGDFLDDPSVANRARVNRLFQGFAQAKQLYDQVRFIDDQGMEVIRINFQGGHATVVPRQELQDKHNRYYFFNSLAINRGEVYFSPLDLNVEHGKVEEPFKPMLRIGTPLYDRKGVKRGVVLLNYLADNLLKRFSETGQGVYSRPLLVNQDGYWLIAPTPEQAWGFMFPDRHHHHIGQTFPIAWSNMGQDDSNTIVGSNGMFVFDTIYPLEKHKITAVAGGADPQPGKLLERTYHWKVISHVPQQELQSIFDHLRNSIFTLYGVVVFVITTVALVMAQKRYADQRARLHSDTQLMQLDVARKELVQTEKMASLGRLVGGFTHEINTPIGIAVGASSQIHNLLDEIQQILGQEEVHEQELLDKLKTMDEATLLTEKNLARAANMIVRFKRTSADQASLDVRSFNVRQAVDDVVGSLHNHFKNTPVGVRIQCHEQLIFRGIPGILEQVITNLLINSLTHAYDNGKQSGVIQLNLQLATDGSLEMLFADDGAGIAHETIGRIFEPFYTTRRHQGGTGLGLYVCYDLVVNQLGGDLHCTSVLGEGTQFTMRMPPLVDPISSASQESA